MDRHVSVIIVGNKVDLFRVNEFIKNIFSSSKKGKKCEIRRRTFFGFQIQNSLFRNKALKNN